MCKFKATIFVLLTILFKNSTAIEITEVIGNFSCPALDNQQKCAIWYEGQLLEKMPALLQRKDGVLKIKLNSGEYKVIADKPDLFNVIEITDNFAIVREQWWEGNTWHIVNLSSGTTMETFGYPLFSPEGDKVICSQEDLLAGYSPNIFELYKVKSGVLVKVFSADALGEGWGPGDVMWIDNDVVSFSKKTINPDGKSWGTGNLYLKIRCLLKMLDGSWQVTHNKRMQSDKPKATPLVCR